MGFPGTGVDRRDRELAKLRIKLFEAAQGVYLEKQKKALGK